MIYNGSDFLVYIDAVCLINTWELKSPISRGGTVAKCGWKMDQVARSSISPKLDRSRRAILVKASGDHQQCQEGMAGMDGQTLESHEVT